LRYGGQRFLESLGERGPGGRALIPILRRADEGRVDTVGLEGELVRLEVDGAPYEEARGLDAVLLRGRYLDRQDLDRVLQEAEQLSDSS
jgi:hypothetical protein